MENVTRPPLLSERLLSIIASLEGNVAEWVIDDLLAIHDELEIYEDLITDGKLRVVEEVELDESGHCLRCGYDVTDRSEPRSPEVPPYCHGCGNKIKR